MSMNERVIYPPLAKHDKLKRNLTPGEQIVLDLFNEHLPVGWEIYIQPHLNGLCPDFVLLNPQGGIAVFEVRDWDLDATRYFTQEDQWGHMELWTVEDGKEICIRNQNPISRVNFCKNEIFNLYCPSLERKTGLKAITAGVIFPFAQTEQVKDLLTPFRKVGFGKYHPVCGKDEITTGNPEAIFPDVNCGDPRLMSEELADDLRGWLVEPDFSAMRRNPLELDNKSRRWVKTRFKNGYRRIKGPAGSGKSYILSARAAQLANEGKSVLVATFNITLWHYLRDLIIRELDMPERMNNIRFMHFHGWCKHVCHEVGWDCRYDDLWNSDSNEQGNDRLNVALPNLAEEAVEHSGASKYDAILVDEGQDYLPSWWNVLRKACKPNGEMLLVADATQDVYGTASAWTNDAMKGAGFTGRWKQLDVSYRLPTDAISFARDFAKKYLDKEVIDIPEYDQGALDLYPSYLRWVQCNPRVAGKTCLNEILSLMKKNEKNDLADAEIIILTENMKSGAGVVSLLAKNGIQATDTFGEDHHRKKMAFYMGSGRIKATTLHSFKGWESRQLVVYITSDVTNEESLNAIYAGLTRLKRHVKGSWLTVVCCQPYFQHFGETFPDFERLE